MDRVIIADSQPLFRDAISAIVADMLAGSGVCEAVGTLAELNAAIEGDDEPACVILDLALLGGGLTDIVGMRRGLASTSFVVLAASIDPQAAHVCMMCGVSGFIPKTASQADITHALQTVFEGGVHMPAFTGIPSATVTPANGADDDADHHSLSGRQMAVLDLVRDGKSNKQIAWELSISETTVKAHMTAILRKLGVNSRAQAIVLLQRQSLAAYGAGRHQRVYASKAA